jgi:phage gp37-like protein
MMKATVRPSLYIKAGCANRPQLGQGLINEPLLRQIYTRRLEKRKTRDMKQGTRASQNKSRNRASPIAVSAQHLTGSVQRSSNGSHDLLVAVAELGALEQRIGYRFNDKLLGVSAFKTSSDDTPVKFNSTRVPMEDWRRLALLGDRVLDLALCHTWYQSGQSRCTLHCSNHILRSLQY